MRDIPRPILLLLSTTMISFSTDETPRYKNSTKIFFAWTLLLVCALPIFAQEAAKPRKVKTTYEIQMYAEPSFHSSKVISIPANVILEMLEETERSKGGYIKATYKNKTGWILKAETQRYMDVPAPELTCWSNGYKISGNVYRYFLVLGNDGMLPYVGNITIRLFDKDGRVVLEKTADFSDGIPPYMTRPFAFDTTVEAPRFEVEYKDGKIKGDTGSLIERL